MLVSKTRCGPALTMLTLWNRKRSNYINYCIITSLIYAVKGNGTLGREGAHTEKLSQGKTKKSIGFSNVALCDLIESLVMGRHVEVSCRGCVQPAKTTTLRR